jgi:hypothetical protein
VNLLNALEKIQQIQQCVQVMENAILLTTAHVTMDIQEINANSLLAF